MLDYRLHMQYTQQHVQYINDIFHLYKGRLSIKISPSKKFVS